MPSLRLEAGGVAQGLRTLSSFYERLGVSATVITMDSHADELGGVEHLTVIRLGQGAGIFSFHKDLIPAIKRYAPDHDAVIVEGLWQYHGYAAYSALKGLDVPYYVFTHGMLDPWFKREYPLKHIKKSIFWWLVQHRVLENARAVLFTCEEERILARDSFSPYRVSEQVVGYGTSLTDDAVEASPDDFLSLFPDLKGRRILLFLSRIQEKKGCDLLIKAFAKVANTYPDVQLVMAGPDQTGWQADLEWLSKELNISGQISWVGMLKAKTKWGALKAADAFVLPSHQENFGIAVAEALAVGTPVLISNKVNIWREISDMEAGLVDDDTLEGTHQLLARWLTMDAEDVLAMAEHCQPCFREKFDMEQAAKNLINFISSDLGCQ